MPCLRTPFPLLKTCSDVCAVTIPPIPTVPQVEMPIPPDWIGSNSFTVRVLALEMKKKRRCRTDCQVSHAVKGFEEASGDIFKRVTTQHKISKAVTSREQEN